MYFYNHLSSDLPSLLSPSFPLPPIHPSMHHYSARSLGTAPPDCSQSCGSAGPRDWGRESLQEEEGVYIWRLFAEGVISPLPASVNSVGAPTVDVSSPPSCSCCMPTCWSEISAEWRRSGCAVQCRSVERGEMYALCLLKCVLLSDMLSLHTHRFMTQYFIRYKLHIYRCTTKDCRQGTMGPRV